MVLKLVEKVNEKIEEGKLLCVASECNASRMIDSVVPEMINVENDEIYIEGDNLILHITNEEEYDIVFDEYEDEFVIQQGNIIYYFK